MDIPLFNDFERRFNDPVWLEIGAEICLRERIDFVKLSPAERGENIVIFIDDRFVLKIYTPKKNGFNRESRALTFARDKTSLTIPEIVESGDFEGYSYLITDRIPGRQTLRPEWLTLDRAAQIGVMSQLAIGLRELHSRDAGEIDFDWNEFIDIQLESVIARQRSEGGNPEWIEGLPGYLQAYLPLLPKNPAQVFMHGDVHFGNLLFTDEKPLQIAGLFDFADSLKGFYEYEFVAIGVLMIQGQGDLQREFFRAYGYSDREINIDLRHRMMLLTILYEHSSLRRYAERLGPGSENLTLDELERAIWSFV
jgi:aminoglycoside phosphotransferase